MEKGGGSDGEEFWINPGGSVRLLSFKLFLLRGLWGVGDSALLATGRCRSVILLSFTLEGVGTYTVKSSRLSWSGWNWSLSTLLREGLIFLLVRKVYYSTSGKEVRKGKKGGCVYLHKQLENGRYF